MRFLQFRELAVISFKWRHFKKSIILMLVRWYLAYSLSYRDIEELAAERGLAVDHSTVNRWVIKYAPLLEESFRRFYKRSVESNWRCDETYIKIKGKSYYLYRAVDKEGKTIDFYLSERRDKKAAKAFFIKCIGSSGMPDKVTVDKSGANRAALKDLELLLSIYYFLTNHFVFFTIRQNKYLNNIIEQDHRFVKRITKPMMDFKAFHSAQATIAGVELHHMLRKQQHKNAANLAIHEQFFALAG